MRAIMLTKTEKRIVILLVVVAIVNCFGNIFIPLYVLTFHYFQSGKEFTAFGWGFVGLIIEILVVAVLILMIRKE